MRIYRLLDCASTCSPGQAPFIFSFPLLWTLGLLGTLNRSGPAFHLSACLTGLCSAFEAPSSQPGRVLLLLRFASVKGFVGNPEMICLFLINCWSLHTFGKETKWYRETHFLEEFEMGCLHNKAYKTPTPTPTSTSTSTPAPAPIIQSPWSRVRRNHLQ